MLNLFQAEWIKIIGNRWASGFLIWIFPVGAFGFIVIFGLILALSPVARENARGDDTGPDANTLQWTKQALDVWDFPVGVMGRLILLGLTSVVFGGEYQWQTWKNIVPRNKRIPLILTKYCMLALVIVLAFALMSFIMAAGYGLLARIVGVSYGPALKGSVIVDFAGDYIQKALLALVAIIISTAYAALGTMITHSIIGGVLVGMLLTYAEALSALGMAVIAHFLDQPVILNLYRLTPGYNLQNVNEWLSHGQPDSANLFDMLEVSDSLEFSAMALAGWVIGLIALSAYYFHRQDIT
ncbi:MAG: ABC transporter permease [Anaerolineae bacterium]|nr:ABC transporter permease [Anaerolineae bacterium]